MMLWFHKWLYKDGRPNAVARLVNRGWAVFHALGLFPNYMVTLEVVGRRSGKVITLPLAMAVVDGERYLVSMLGANSSWVLNVRAAGGQAVLKHGQTEQIVLEEVPVEKRAPILKAYLQRSPGGRQHIPVDRDAPLPEFEAIAGQFPVFRISQSQIM